MGAGVHFCGADEIHHPAHLALLEWLVPLIDPVELDFEARVFDRGIDVRFLLVRRCVGKVINLKKFVNGASPGSAK